MKKTVYLIAMAFVLFFAGCKNNTNKGKKAEQTTPHFTVKDYLPAGRYLYIVGEENGAKHWYAITAREVEKGDVFYYEEPLVMTDFFSKELDRPFDTVLFLSKVGKSPEAIIQKPAMQSMQSSHKGKVTTTRKKIDLEKPEGAMSIAEVYEQQADLEGKKVKVYGEVIKFNPEIMKTNWVHLQDGTSSNGKYDLTITTDEMLPVGKAVVLEGVLSRKKDFGYGYYYDVLIEKAKLVK